jgi:hypothetical protein
VCVFFWAARAVPMSVATTIKKIELALRMLLWSFSILSYVDSQKWLSRFKDSLRSL